MSEHLTRRARLFRRVVLPLTALVLVALGTGIALAVDHGPHKGAARNPAATSAGSAPPPTAATTTPTTAATPAPPTTTPAAQPLAGRVVGIDPGHNGQNGANPSVINALVWNGRANETCDTTGTETDSGYTEAQFNWNVAQYLTSDLQAEGAHVVLTRNSNDGVGPCVNTRAQILDDAHADVAVDIHADGGPASGRGFAILEPVADGTNAAVITSSDAFGTIVRNTFAATTSMPISTYDGTAGFAPRTDLAGLNLTTVPKILIECGNMRNATDAALLTSPAFQQLAAKALAQSVTTFLTPTS